ncbi:hypothetical protein HYPSUDRAFT_49972 [Hypholoma sublateritium FD-334 SS-4]|uniref:Uncharacterized protein n=1 Tax=Hypholoma sublateritium (strain FD-334 SS-4) TaxID=945553 RepID=A0A0D2KFQ9_HYPSF|nr:hypothetical protein HYPSUDRAFT_49972 [Hypholoma sublateritium FD-334 SS-4]
MWRDSIDELFLRSQHPSLEGRLAEACSSSAIHIKITLRISIACQDNVLDIPAFEEECEVYARQSFSRLDKISGLTLSFAISTSFTSD